MILPNEYLVCFYDPVDGPKRWWHRFLKKGFRHCNCIAFLAQLDRWMVVDWSTPGVAVYLLSSEEIRAPLAGLRQSGRVLRVPFDLEGRLHLGVFAIGFWCVVMVRHLTGIRTWALTPWQLFCVLRDLGCEEMFRGEKENIAP